VHAPDSPDLAEVFARDGVVLVADACPPDTIRELTRNVERYRKWIAPAVPPEWVRYEPDGNVRGMYFLDRVDPWFAEFCSSDRLRALVERIAGRPVDAAGVETFDKPPGGSPSLVHQDGIYQEGTARQVLNAWIAVDDATPANGALHYWPGLHRNGLLPHVPAPDDPTLQTVAPEVLATLGGPRTAVLPSGSLAVHHPRAVHGSPGNDSVGSRRAVVVAYELR
jgi:ectoine hydroxylase-related dioxygenase (phytanoyl-CoA dioxygenase family)